MVYYRNRQKRQKHYRNVFVNFEIFVVFGMKYHDVGNSEKERKDEKERKSFSEFRDFRYYFIEGVADAQNLTKI